MIRVLIVDDSPVVRAGVDVLRGRDYGHPRGVGDPADGDLGAQPPARVLPLGAGVG